MTMMITHHLSDFDKSKATEKFVHSLGKWIPGSANPDPMWGNIGSYTGKETMQEFIVIGNDGGLIDRPIPVTAPDTLRMSMAERYEVIIDFSKYPIGTRLYLQNTGPKSQVDFDTPVKPLMCFDVTYNEPEESEIPSQLRPFTVLSEADAEKERSFVYERKDGHWVIDRQVWDPQRIDSYIEPGAIEIWTFINPQKGKLHPVHLHAVEGQILDRNGKEPFPYERGWKDVFHVGSEETVRVILQFATRDGSPVVGKYMTHCHHLQHEDNGMMSQFVVGDDRIDPVTTAPAQVAGHPLRRMLSSLFDG